MPPMKRMKRKNASKSVGKSKAKGEKAGETKSRTDLSNVKFKDNFKKDVAPESEVRIYLHTNLLARFLVRKSNLQY